MKLLVAEKPSVATQHYRPMLERAAGEQFTQRDGYLQGKEYAITWCVGHLITLAPLDKYPGMEGNWKLGPLPLLPDKFILEPIERTQKQLNIVQGLMNQADTLINGADAGREGNLIFDLILDHNPAFKQKTVQRLWVNSYVPKELDKAFSSLESAKDRENLSYAARLRQRADWMVGLNATRGYTLTAGRGKLISVGRVQTPTLNLIVERDFQVENFKEFFHYSVLGNWRGFKAQWLREDKAAWMEAEKLPNAIVEKCTDKPAEIQKIANQTKKQFPKKPFDLTELQKEANKRFKMKVQEVLDNAQNLYEKKLITYPRTDAPYLPDAMKDDSYDLAMRMANEKQKALFRKKSEKFVFVNSKKVTDHYAIIPTGEQTTNLPPGEMKVLNLVIERFLMAWMEPKIWKEMTTDLKCEGEDFRIKIRQPVQEGWTSLLPKKEAAVEQSRSQPGKEKTKADSKKDDDSEENEEEPSNTVDTLPAWKKGESDPFESLELQKKKKAKPKYYTEATLLTAMKTAGKQLEDEELAEAMKERGLGTPATQAGIIETLKKRDFVEERKNSLVSTERGRQVIELVDEKIKSPELTGEWEYRLSQIEKGAYSPVEFRDGIMEFVRDLFSGMKTTYSAQFALENSQEEFGCPKCDCKLYIRPWGYQCSDEHCNFRLSNMVAKRPLTLAEMKSLLTEGRTEVLKGFMSKKKKPFSAVLTMNKSGEIEFEFDGVEGEGKDREECCPKCGALLKDNGNRIFCIDSSCGFVLFKITAGIEVSDEHLHQLLVDGRTPVLDGFTSKKGKSFRAALVLDTAGKTSFEFEDSGSFSGEKTKYNCPKCEKPLLENKKTVFCEDDGCGFVFFKNMSRKAIPKKQINLLFTKGITDTIEGFKSKKGSKFAAKVKFSSDGRAEFQFEDRPQNGGGAGGQAATDFQAPPMEALTNPDAQGLFCPSCGSFMSMDSNWCYCSMAQCGFSIPKRFYQKELSAEEIGLLLKEKKTPVLEGFISTKTDPNGQAFKASLILDEKQQLRFDPATVEKI